MFFVNGKCIIMVKMLNVFPLFPNVYGTTFKIEKKNCLQKMPTSDTSDKKKKRRKNQFILFYV